MALKDCETRTEELLQFIGESPSVFHAVESIKKRLLSAGYAELKEAEEWRLLAGGRYFVTRNDSSIAAFSIPEDNGQEEEKNSLAKVKGFHIAAAHSDSPSFKIKENPEMKAEGQYVRLNTEKYGGMIMSTWLDRALSVAGRVVCRQEGRLVSRLVNVDRDMLVIPNLAIHMHRDMNQGVEYNAQSDMLPLYGEAGSETNFMETIAKAADVAPEDILAHDLFLYVREKGKVIGGSREFILSPRLDDLQCAFAAVTAMAESTPRDYINICMVFDNEEIGSSTRQGADSTFLADVMARIQEAFGKADGWLRQKTADSFLISADNAHAVHPNHPEKADPVNRPVLNGGIVIKYHGSQRYATDALTAAGIKELCREADVPVQVYTNRSDIAGGLTLGNISVTHVSVPTADIGLPQLAMHSALETAGSRDTAYAVHMFKTFYSK
ncbi:MAG: M18 family aminopeptidase [Lachnospiraceae bacterium]|nr:M18 family aminopeptidase [Lachnospiraceae bacterium]